MWEIEVDGTTGGLLNPSPPLIADVPDPSYSAGYGINNFGDVCGRSGDAPFVTLAGQTSYTLSVPRKAYLAKAHSINDFGEIVGYAEIPEKGDSSPPYSKYAYLWVEGQRIDLSEKILPGSDWERLEEGKVINSNGTIGGYGQHAGKTLGFIMNPFDEP